MKIREFVKEHDGERVMGMFQGLVIHPEGTMVKETELHVFTADEMKARQSMQPHEWRDTGKYFPAGGIKHAFGIAMAINPRITTNEDEREGISFFFHLKDVANLEWLEGDENYSETYLCSFVPAVGNAGKSWEATDMELERRLTWDEWKQIAGIKPATPRAE